jgi:hypothetical protein
MNCSMPLISGDAWLFLMSFPSGMNSSWICA